MTKQKQLEELKKQVAKLEEEIKNEPVIQIIPEKKLEWGITASEIMTWKDSKKWCEEQGEGWRLPTAKELFSAYDNKVDGFVFSYYWSATEYSDTDARYVNFTSGGQTITSKTNSNYVRCVRDM